MCSIQVIYIRSILSRRFDVGLNVFQSFQKKFIFGKYLDSIYLVIKSKISSICTDFSKHYKMSFHCIFFNIFDPICFHRRHCLKTLFHFHLAEHFCLNFSLLFRNTMNTTLFLTFFLQYISLHLGLICTVMRWGPYSTLCIGSYFGHLQIKSNPFHPCNYQYMRFLIIHFSWYTNFQIYRIHFLHIELRTMVETIFELLIFQQHRACYRKSFL